MLPVLRDQGSPTSVATGESVSLSAIHSKVGFTQGCFHGRSLPAREGRGFQEPRIMALGRGAAGKGSAKGTPVALARRSHQNYDRLGREGTGVRRAAWKQGGRLFVGVKSLEQGGAVDQGDPCSGSSSGVGSPCYSPKLPPPRHVQCMLRDCVDSGCVHPCTHSTET